jgi:hypothetical protein
VRIVHQDRTQNEALGIQIARETFFKRETSGRHQVVLPYSGKIAYRILNSAVCFVCIALCKIAFRRALFRTSYKPLRITVHESPPRKLCTDVHRGSTLNISYFLCFIRSGVVLPTFSPIRRGPAIQITEYKSVPALYEKM